MKHIGKFNISKIPSNRLGTIDIGVASQSKHHISAMIELDVTQPRLLLKETPKERKVSFTTWLVKCIGDAVNENKQVQGIIYKKRKIVVFESVDIAFMIERELNGEKQPFPLIIRDIAHKSLNQVQSEIESAQSQAIKDEGNFVLGERKNARSMKLYTHLPSFARNLVWKKILKSPYMIKEHLGTVMVTSVGMAGKVNGWIIPKTVHPVSFSIGSVVKKPGLKNGVIEIRDYMFVTVTINHDVIDGVPAMKLLSKLTKMIESGYGLI